MYKISWPHAHIVDKISLSRVHFFFLIISQKSANNCTGIRKKILVKKSVKSPMEQIYIQEKIFDINNDIEDRLTICSPLPLA